MREIKFRAWNANEQAWVVPYGGLEVWTAKEFLPGFNVDAKHKYILSQFTGLRDRNNREIYEGDIVRLLWESIHEARTFTAKIIWASGGFWFQGIDFKASDCNWHQYNESDREVIGNIFENSDLLTTREGRV